MKHVMALGVLLAACGGSGGGSTDVKPTLVFADRSDAEIARLISAAGGTDMFSAQSRIDSFSAGNGDPCPAIAASGDTVTITGGCTTQDGIMITGSASAQNPTSFDQQVQYDFSKDTVYTFDQLALTQSGFTATYDGIVKIEGTFTTYDADLTVTQSPDNVSMRSDLYYHCDAGTKVCTLSGSGLELAGAGGVLASGSVSLQNQTSTARYTLEGKDTLTATITQGCVAWKIEGTDRQSTPCP